MPNKNAVPDPNDPTPDPDYEPSDPDSESGAKLKQDAATLGDALAEEGAAKKEEPEIFTPKRIELEYGEHKKRQTATVKQHTSIQELLEHCHLPTDGSHVIHDPEGRPYHLLSSALNDPDALYHHVKNGQVVPIHQVAKGREHPVAQKPIVSGS